MALLRPSLSLDFARTSRIDPRLSWTRADASACATYVDRFGVIKTASPNIARIAHDPDTFAPLGSLIEASRTNRLIRSAELDNAAWTKSELTATADQATAPDATVSADSLIPSTNNAAHYFYRDYTISAAEAQTLTGFFKAGGYSKIKLRIGTTDDVSYVEATFDLSAGTAGTTTAAGSAAAYAADIKYYRAYGFYRCRVSATQLDGAATTARAKCFVLSSGGSEIFAGDGVSLVYGWGLQAERNDTATSHIPTSSAAVTRATDALSLSDLSWYNGLEGTFIAEAEVRIASVNSFVFSLDDGSSNNRIAFNIAAGGIATLTVTSGGVAQASVEGPNAYGHRERATLAGSYKANEFRFATNKGVGDADTSGSVPTGMTALRLGATISTNTPLNAPLSHLAYIPKALSDGELKQLVMRRAA